MDHNEEKWGVYPEEELSEIHIVPCDSEGYTIAGHEVTVECFCNPSKIIEENGWTIWEHHSDSDNRAG